MPCIFCIAMIGMIGAAITQAVVDSMSDSLADVADGDVRTAADTSTMTRFELEVEVPGKPGETTGAVVTVYKQQGRVRIQLLSHDLTREQIREIERRIAAALEAEIVEETDERDEQQVRDATSDDHDHDHDDGHESPEDGWRTREEQGEPDRRANRKPAR